MTEKPLPVWTATRRNSMSETETRAFLDEALVARLATNRADGFVHLTPVWYLHESGLVHFTLGTRRRTCATFAAIRARRFSSMSTSGQRSARAARCAR